MVYIIHTSMHIYGKLFIVVCCNDILEQALWKWQQSRYM